MSDYKQTLNLPKTDFPMKANLAQREPELLKKWENLHLYAQLRDMGKKRKKFILLDGPPYANGHIHMGTTVNKVLKDIVVKSKTLSGYDAPFIPGWDCHGLPIESNVEKKIGKAGHKVSPTEFRKACREYALTQINYQRAEFQRLGVIADWAHPYLTMDFSFEANIVRSLAKIFQQGHIQRGAKPVYWCLDCASALAEAEVEYADKTSSAIDVRFAVVDEAAFLARFQQAPAAGKGPIAIPIWTTTPWTLPANQMVALNPFVEYVLVECDGKERLLIAEPLLETVLQRYGVKNHRILAKTVGETLEHISLHHPFYERDVPLVLASFVTVDSGTGAVHGAGAHGVDDFAVAEQYQLPLINLIGNDGIFTEDAGFLAGQHVTKVNGLVLDVLEKQGALLYATTMAHSYPHCWRHKTPVIFRATPQWFISMEKKGLRAQALAAIKEVQWVPDWGQNRIYSMVENRPDWCISRQRYWGPPIAVFLHKETGELHPRTQTLFEKVAELIEQEGVDAWFNLDPHTLLGAEADHYLKCNDILDVWFDSGVVHECVLRQRPELHFPADLFLEGSDQHRGWFNSSLVSSVAMNGEAPYKTVLTHGFVIDVQGRKMSKSLGNVISPETIMQSLGADVLRLWVSSIDYRGDIFISDEILSRTSETYRRLRNTARFLLSNLAGFDPKKHAVPAKKMLALDRWVVDRARLLQEEIIQAYETYQFHTIYQKLQQFCSVELGGFYLDIIKDRQYTTPTDSLARRSTQTAMFHIIEAMVRWFAPILSFTAEEIWHYIPGKRNESVFLNTWYTELPALKDTELMNQAYWENIRLVRDVVNKALEQCRHAGQLGAPLEAAVHLYCEPALKKQLDALGNELRFVLITSQAEVHLANAHMEHVQTTDMPGLWLTIQPLITVPKCERCWHRSADIGSHVQYPTLCGRCIENIEGAGEVRHYA